MLRASGRKLLFHSYHGASVVVAYNSLFSGKQLACPFFIPRQIVNDGSWPHPSRLPLGAGWSGACSAAGGEIPAAPEHIREFCNLGYAIECPHLPRERDWDAVRFAISRTSAEQVTLQYACELAHAPAAHGTLTYDLKSECWRNPHPDARIQRLATSYLHAYRVRQSGGSV